ncbi:LuxR family transcriptional regulator, maltose regulon positive regulatory protein [Paenibacillus sp. OV219]|nr:LuxR family transcriptional regulator, maltose regulon positive regulatory protein [Paenibacillus sp. OV219]
MIVKTKLQVPHVNKSLVSRPRLIRKLNEGLKAKLTIVSAQAGYGKTTALSEWVKQSSVLVAWVSLDRQDNDWIPFWSYVTASIQKIIPSFGQTIGHLLDLGPAVSAENIIKELLNELNEITGELVIILDDYHIIELPDIHHSLSYLLERLPRHIHLYIASRIDLPMPTARLLAKGELLRILEEDLRFQLDEGFVYFRDTTDLLLTTTQVTELFRQTEGWISGLQLAAISLKRSNHIAESIHQFRGKQNYIFDYLLEEVLNQQSASIRAFLLDTSILSRMNRSLCQAVTGQQNSQEQLEKLEKLNLFIVPLDEERNWYRYHHLLSDFLRHLWSRTDPDQMIQAHIRAAKWLEHHGFDEEAVEQYLEAKEFEDVIRLIEKNPPAMMQSKSDALMRWISRLPESVFAEKPMIEIFYISVMMLGGKWGTAFQRVWKIKDRFEALQGELPEDDWKKVMGNIYFYCGIASYIQNDLVRASDYFELSERFMPEGSFFQLIGQNRYQEDSANYDQLTLIKDLPAVEVYLLKWIKVWEYKNHYPFIGYMYLTYINLMYEWNRLEEAGFYISQSWGRKDLQPLARIMIQLGIAASRIEQAEGNPKQASELLVQVKSKIVSPDYDLFISKIEAEQAYLTLRQGSLQNAFDWLQGCGLAHTDEMLLSDLAEYLVLSRVLAASERIEEALYLLERLYLLVDKGGQLRERIKVLIVHCVTLWRSGQTETALVQLVTTLQLAEPEGYIRSFVDEGSVMAEMLTAYSKVQQDGGMPSLAYAKQLIQALNATREEVMAPKELLTEQESKILRFIANGLLNKEIAYNLNITGETVKFHIKNMYRKLGVHNRVQALQRAKQLQFLM